MLMILNDSSGNTKQQRSIPALAQSALKTGQAYNVLQGDETFKRQLAAADASRLHTVVDNRLGVAARMELDFGDNM